jgi:hypothetical protein
MRQEIIASWGIVIGLFLILLASSALEAREFEEIPLPNYINIANRDRKSTRLNSSHIPLSRMPSSA